MRRVADFSITLRVGSQVVMMSAVLTTSVKEKDVALVGRQPICAADGTLQAYQLLFRSSETEADFTDANRATSTVLLNTFVEIGLDRVVGNRKAFVKLTREFLVGEHPLPPRPDLLFVEVPQDVEIDDELVKGVAAHKKRGFSISLDAREYHKDLEPLLILTDIVRVDLRNTPIDQLQEHCRPFRRWPVKFLGQRIETAEEFEACKSLGFAMFQGFFLAKPHVLQRVKTHTNKVIVLQLLAQVCAKQFAFAELANTVKQDAGLCCRFLRYVNSAFNGLQSIRSVDHALIMMGSKGIRALTAMLQLSGVADMPEQHVVSAVLRGQMCRLLAEKLLPAEAESLSTLGILSTLDVLLDEPMELLLDDLPITPSMRAALLTHAGVSGQILKAVVAYETSDWQNAKLEGMNKIALRDAYLAALERADEVVTTLMATKSQGIQPGIKD